MKVDVHGVELEMEERVCVGGCGKKFRCLKTSTAEYARKDCHIACKGGNRTPEENRAVHRSTTDPSSSQPHKFYIKSNKNLWWI